jgi:hypothetical protein
MKDVKWAVYNQIRHTSRYRLLIQVDTFVYDQIWNEARSQASGQPSSQVWQMICNTIDVKL